MNAFNDLETLVARIVHPPRDLDATLRFISGRASALRKLGADLIAVLDQQEDVKDDVLSAIGIWDESDVLVRYDRYLKAIEDGMSKLELFKRTASTSSEYHQDASSVINRLLDMGGPVPSLEDQNNKRLSSGSYDIPYLKDFCRDADCPPRAVNLAVRYDMAMTDLATKIRPRLVSLLSSIEEMARQDSLGEYDDRLRPSSDDVETLYHASTNARNIARKGFDKDVPTGGGIGGTQSTKSHKAGISFTSDLRSAREIARTLKEIVALLQGKYSLNALLEDMRLDGSYDAVVNAWSKEVRHPLPPKNDVELYDLYDKWLWMSKVKFNPVFFGSSTDMVRAFKRANLKDIGIVAADVDMTDPDIMYLNALHEYRVPPDAVVSVKKLIR